ncbi:patatin-like phospholipase family protein [Nocardia sp. CA-129566]|uniref:patatin-like phospholipase family protein n=1 Tax=Nocardia sp. CA-129566 TaxID=3239976 RepID=UPI003D98619A
MQGETYWDHDHPVLRALRLRSAQGYDSTIDDDGNRIGLVVEGGGMRGIVSAAMLCAIEDAGYSRCFDAIYASSAGAMNATYFVCGESWYPMSIYYDDLASTTFIDFRRLLRGDSFFDVDFAFACAENKRIWDFEAVAAKKPSLHIAITDVDNIATVFAEEFDSAGDFRAALYASCWMPRSRITTTHWRGMRALDGSILTTHPLRLAVKQDFTHLLSLSTRPLSRTTGANRRTVPQLAVAWHLERFERGLGTGYLGAVHDYWIERADVARQRWIPDTALPVLEVAPLPWMPAVKRHETDVAKLIASARESYGLMHCALHGYPLSHLRDGAVQVVPRLTVVNRDPASAVAPLPPAES